MAAVKCQTAANFFLVVQALISELNLQSHYDALANVHQLQ